MSIILDTVDVYVDAISRLVTDLCKTDSADDQCVTGQRLLPYLLSINHSGHNGNISFDKNGDILGRYEIMNFRRVGGSSSATYEARAVGVWDTISETLDINDSQIIWSSPSSSSAAAGPPRSSCGRECAVGEVYHYIPTTCCWRCRRCGPSEIAVDNATRCQSCPQFYWPEPVNQTDCLPIIPTLISYTDAVVIVFAAFTVVGISSTLIVLVIYVRHNDARIIKATSRELSYMMLAGVVIQVRRSHVLQDQGVNLCSRFGAKVLRVEVNKMSSSRAG